VTDATRFDINSEALDALPLDKLPVAISALADLAGGHRRNPLYRFERSATVMRSSPRISSPISSVRAVSTWPLRSPLAMRSVACRASFSGCRIEWAMYAVDSTSSTIRPNMTPQTR